MSMPVWVLIFLSATRQISHSALSSFLISIAPEPLQCSASCLSVCSIATFFDENSSPVHIWHIVLGKICIHAHALQIIFCLNEVGLYPVLFPIVATWGSSGPWVLLTCELPNTSTLPELPPKRVEEWIRIRWANGWRRIGYSTSMRDWSVQHRW